MDNADHGDDQEYGDNEEPLDSRGDFAPGVVFIAFIHPLGSSEWINDDRR